MNIQSAVLVSAALLAACAHAPSTFPPSSAAAPEASAAPLWAGGRALVEDPPLPGAGGEGWVGLGTAAPSADPHAGHHMHGRHVMPDGTVMDMSDMPATEVPTTETPDAGTDAGMEGMHHGH